MPASLAFAALSAMSLGAQATTLDFESLARGTVITTHLQAQGVLVSGIDSTGCCQPGRVLDVTLGDLGVLPFGGSGQQALVYGVPSDQLTFTFVLPSTSTPEILWTFRHVIGRRRQWSPPPPRHAKAQTPLSRGVCVSGPQVCR